MANKRWLIINYKKAKQPKTKSSKAKKVYLQTAILITIMTQWNESECKKGVAHSFSTPRATLINNYFLQIFDLYLVHLFCTVFDLPSLIWEEKAVFCIKNYMHRFDVQKLVEFISFWLISIKNSLKNANCRKYLLTLKRRIHEKFKKNKHRSLLNYVNRFEEKKYSVKEKVVGKLCNTANWNCEYTFRQKE